MLPYITICYIESRFFSAPGTIAHGSNTLLVGSYVNNDLRHQYGILRRWSVNVSPAKRSSGEKRRETALFHARAFRVCPILYEGVTCYSWIPPKCIFNQLIPIKRKQRSEEASLKKQPTFGDATTGFPSTWRLRKERTNSILMTRHYPDLGSDESSVRNFCARFSDVIWRGNQWVASPNVGCSLRLRGSTRSNFTL